MEKINVTGILNSFKEVVVKTCDNVSHGLEAAPSLADFLQSLYCNEAQREFKQGHIWRNTIIKIALYMFLGHFIAGDFSNIEKIAMAIVVAVPGLSCWLYSLMTNSHAIKDAVRSILPCVNISLRWGIAVKALYLAVSAVIAIPVIGKVILLAFVGFNLPAKAKEAIRSFIL
jgi:hypothetical protein